MERPAAVIGERKACTRDAALTCSSGRCPACSSGRCPTCSSGCFPACSSGRCPAWSSETLLRHVDFDIIDTRRCRCEEGLQQKRKGGEERWNEVDGTLLCCFLLLVFPCSVLCCILPLFYVSTAFLYNVLLTRLSSHNFLCLL
ncbi:hypothetical protein RchiOBHm_Chr6g0265591 [Rosa chinensis]|uniref:Uncharacterized protein n=1 Tax=Rosa chinensis TaxID=74649 RepID=A0A2P6PPF6_ROSCH|nr:hypothetical protein RchiOBHm_Chr6g0265591 [Rosa chinensis]